MNTTGKLTIAREADPSAAELYFAQNLRDFATGLHFHSEVQIIAVSEGERSFAFRNRKLVLSSGDCLVIPSYEPHFGSSVPHVSATFKSVYLSESCLHDLPELGSYFRGRSSPVVLHDVDFTQMFAGQGTERDFDIKSIRNLIMCNKSVLLRDDIRPEDIDRQPSTALMTARRILTSEIIAPPSLGKLSRMVGMSKYHLTRQFSKVFGMSPYAFNLRCRLNQSKILLARGEPASAVAHDLGFFDQSHFGLHFRRVMGLSPAAYQRKLN